MQINKGEFKGNIGRPGDDRFKRPCKCGSWDTKAIKEIDKTGLMYRIRCTKCGQQTPGARRLALCMWYWNQGHTAEYP